MVSCDDQDHQQPQLLAGGGSGRPTIESSTQTECEAVESTELKQSGGGAGDSVVDVIMQLKMDQEECNTRAEERITRTEERITRAEERITRVECNTRAEDITRAVGRNTRAVGRNTRAVGRNTRAIVRQFSNKVEHDVSMSVCVCMTAYAHVHVCTYLCADVHESFS